MRIAVLEFAVLVTGALLILDVVIQLTKGELRRRDDDDYDGRTKR